MEHQEIGKEEGSVKRGWNEFVTGKHTMLCEFELSKKRIVNRPTQVDKGRVAEAEFRKWLRQFLPKRYGVTSGYIISQGNAFSTRNFLENKLMHYDVIIYDELNSPILWIDGNSDQSEQGKINAVPAEYVHGVLEVKSTFNDKNIQDALKKLDELSPLLAGVDNEDEPYKRYIPKNFYMGMVFFELLKEDQEKRRLLKKLIPTNPQLISTMISTNPQRGLIGGIVLQAEGFDRDLTGKFEYFYAGSTPVPKYRGKIDRSIITRGLSESREILPGHHFSCLMHFSQANFSLFAFDLVAVINGTYRPGFISSFHGLSFVLPSQMEAG